jgi:hypothetical protein
MFDYIVLLMQEFNQLGEHLVSSSHPVFVFLLLLTFVHHLSQPKWLGMALFCCHNDEVYAKTSCFQGLARLLA